jgi:hypothetical protein
MSMVGMLAATLAATVALHRLGSLSFLQIDWCCLGEWLQSNLFTDVIAAIARVGALAGCYWLLASSALYLVASLTRQAAVIRSVAWATLPAMRRWTDRAITSSALVTTLSLPVAAAWATGDEVKPGYVPIPAGTEQTTTTTTMATSTTTTTIPAPTTSMPSRPDVSPASRATGAIEITVRSGDNFWRLAEARMREVVGRDPTDSEVAPYWREVVEANLGRIRSGNPDLIFPGEVVVMPPIEVRE